ncbi:hypothetical protein PG993_006276 [Apiospora rasikravindrae]|uniref:Uncharacterized protein n=1 Tax=Apiospora rasikravindrae TaxID=990691 RepID=A0ABR1T588_9PEZI
MSGEDTSGGGGPSGQAAGVKRPSDSSDNGADSAKKPKSLFGPVDTFSAPATNMFSPVSQPPASSLFSNSPIPSMPLTATGTSLFGNPYTSGVSPQVPSWPPFSNAPNASPYGSRENPVKNNFLPQVIQGKTSTFTPPSIQGFAQQQEKPNPSVQDLTKEISELKKRLVALEKPNAEVEYLLRDVSELTKRLATLEKNIAFNKSSPTPIRSRGNFVHAEEYLAWLQQLDLRPPEGIINWVKADFAFNTVDLVNFGHLKLTLARGGSLCIMPTIFESDKEQSEAEWDHDFFQKQYRSNCIELTTSEPQNVLVVTPKYLLQLGSVYVIRLHKGGQAGCSPFLAGTLCMDICNPARSLWLVARGNTVFLPSRFNLDLAEAGRLSFDVAKLVDDIREVCPSGSSDFVLHNNEQMIQTLKKSACTVSGELVWNKPNALKLGRAIRKGWAEDKDV